MSFKAISLNSKMTELIETIVGTVLFQDKMQIRLFGTSETPFFSSGDVCKILGIKNHIDATSKIPAEWKGKASIQTVSGMQRINVVSEAGMYFIILRSNKPNAFKLQKWVCEEVLPSLRRYGKYQWDEERKKIMEDHKDRVNQLELELGRHNDEMDGLRRPWEYYYS